MLLSPRSLDHNPLSQWSIIWLLCQCARNICCLSILC